MIRSRLCALRGDTKSKHKNVEAERSAADALDDVPLAHNIVARVAEFFDARDAAARAAPIPTHGTKAAPKTGSIVDVWCIRETLV